ncbi:MAG: hypothetical protein RLZZ182_2068 [Pseudomonadota bacterium]|jgi:hypothetical protein
MHITLRRPCAAAALALFGLAASTSVAHAQSGSFAAVAMPNDPRSLQVEQWYVAVQTVSSTTTSPTAYDHSAFITVPEVPGLPWAPAGLINTSAVIDESNGRATAQARNAFDSLSATLDNAQSVGLEGASLAVSFADISYTFYTRTPGPVTFTATLTGRLDSANPGDAFGVAFVTNELALSNVGLEAVADSVGIDLDLEELPLVQNIRDAAPTIDVRTGDVTLRKDSSLPGGVTVSDTGFSLVSQGRLIDCGGVLSLPICGTYQHAIGMGLLVAATNGASIQYGLSLSGVQAPVPEPGTVALTLSGLAGLAVWRRRPMRATAKA